jgi:hypothetical protein
MHMASKKGITAMTKKSIPNDLETGHANLSKR